MMTEAPAAVVAEIAPAIAAALGDGWTAIPSPHHENAATLSGPDGAQLFMWSNAYPHKYERAEIVGEYPEHKPHDVQRHAITVSMAKSAERIAGDITRRLLPAYLPDLARAQESQAQHDAYAARTASNAGSLTSSPVVSKSANEWRSSSTRQEHSLNLRHHDAYGTLTISGDRASLELNSLPADVVARILAVLEES